MGHLPIFVIEGNSVNLNTIAMRKLKLQIQMTIDGFVAGPNGELDWMWLPVERDPAGFQKVIELADSCDTILLGRKMTPEFIDHWENGAVSEGISPAKTLAHRMVSMRKIVFSRTETDIKGKNLEVENGDLATAIQALKKERGKDIIVYGGANFVNSLINKDLIDEYYIIRNPVAIGSGLSIFTQRKMLKLESTITFKDGKVLNKYLPG
jgi:dihydrofolate reductase